MMIEIKGRTPFSESNKYLRQVRDRSTTRGLTVALATPSTGQAASQRPLDAARVQGEGTRGSRQGPRRRRTVGVVPRAPGETGGQASRRVRGRGGAREDARQGRHHALGHGAPQGSAGARAGARGERVRALARTRADPDARAPAPVDVHPRGVFRRGAGGTIAARAGGRSDGTNRSSASPGTTAVPRPRREARRTSSSRSSAPHRVRHRHPRRRSRCLPRPASPSCPAPRARATRARPPTRRRRPSPATRGYGPAPEHDRAVVSQRAAGPPPPPVSARAVREFRAGPRVPAIAVGMGTRTGGSCARARATSRRLTVETGRRMTRGVPVPVPVLPGLVPNRFRAGDGLGTRPMAAGGSGSRSVGGWPDRDRDPDRLGGRPGPDRGGRRDDRAPQGPYDRERGERRRSRWRMEYRGARPARMAGQRETPGPTSINPRRPKTRRGARREDVHRVKMSFHFGFATTPGEKRRRFSPRAARFPDAPRPLSPDARSRSNRARRSIVRPRPPPRVPESTQSRTGAAVVPEYYSRAHSRAPGKATARAHPRTFDPGILPPGL